MRRITGVLSGKGGVGKTTVSVNLGLAMHKLGEDVIVVDGDMKNPNFGLHLGVFDYHTTIQDVLERDYPSTMDPSERGSSILDALHIHKTGLRFIPASISLQYLNIDSTSLKDTFASIDSDVLIDSPPGLGKDVTSVLEACDEIIIVTAPHLPDLTDCLKTIQVARDMGVTIKGIVLNSARGKSYEVSTQEIEAISATKILQAIPWDERVLKSLSMKVPVVESYPHSRASIAFYKLASQFTGKDYNKPGFLGLRRFISSFQPSR